MFKKSKKNQKGFTLVELLVMLVILAVIMIIAVPNITGILSRNRSTTYIEDAKKLITRAEYKFRGNSETMQLEKGNCILMSLRYLDNAEFESPPNNGEYLKDQSFVVVKRENSSYNYYVRLVEKLKNKEEYRGVLLNSSKDLYQEDSYSLVDNIDSSNLFNVNSYISNPDGVKGLISSIGCNNVSVFGDGESDSSDA